MKVVIASAILFLIVIAAVIGNAVYSDTVLDKLHMLAENAYKNSTSDEMLSELCDYWESYRDYFSLTASLKDIDSVTENLLNFKTATQNGNTTGRDQSYILLCNALDDIARFEKISFVNIF